MGEYIFKVKLSDIRTVSLLDKRGFLTICLVMNSLREGRIYLRRSEGIRDWYNMLKVSNSLDIEICFVFLVLVLCWRVQEEERVLAPRRWVDPGFEQD